MRVSSEGKGECLVYIAKELCIIVASIQLVYTVVHPWSGGDGRDRVCLHWAG